MVKNRDIRHLKSAGYSAAKSAAKSTESAVGKVAEKAAVGIFRWATTDHIGKGKAFDHMPTTGFADALGYILMELIFGILGAVLAGAIAYVGIAYGIPLLIDLML